MRTMETFAKLPSTKLGVFITASHLAGFNIWIFIVGVLRKWGDWTMLVIGSFSAM